MGDIPLGSRTLNVFLCICRIIACLTDWFNMSRPDL